MKRRNRHGAITCTPLPKVAPSLRDVGFALGIIGIICILFLPIPPFLIDMGLAFSIAFSVLILMVALWIQKPLDFSSFPTILLIATMTRLALNIATTRVILSHGNEGHEAAGGVIAGFASLVMSGDFVIGLIVFLILITINFIVITKGATRIAEVGARFTLTPSPASRCRSTPIFRPASSTRGSSAPAQGTRGGKLLLRCDGRCVEVRAR